MKVSKRLTLILSIVLILGVFAGMVAAEESSKRIYGENRYATSVEIAKALYPDGVEQVILARGEYEGLYADGLSASTLAGHLDAPVLLTRQDVLPEEVKVALKDLGVKTVYIMGGEVAVSQKVEGTIEDLGIKTVRIEGENRYDTAAQIANYVADHGELAGFAFIVNGHAPADSLVAGSIASGKVAPILQVGANKVPEETKAAIEALGIKNVYIVGGTSVVSKAVENSLAKLVNVQGRLAGDDRFETSVEFAEAMFAGVDDVTIVRGQDLNLADAIGAAVLGQPIIYVSKDIPAAVGDYLDERLSPYSDVKVIGGEVAVSKEIVEAIESKMKATEITQDDFESGAELEGKFVILKSGVYGPQSGSVAIDGTLYLDPGADGEITLRNVTADRVVVKSGSQNSIILDSVNADNLTVDTEDQDEPVRINTTGSTEISQTTVASHVILDRTSGAFGEINISGTDEEKQVTLRGDLSNHTINVNSPATINVPQGTSVGALILNSPVNIEGSGSLGKVIIATPGVVIDNPPAEVIILEGVTAIIGGQEQTGTASPEEIREAIEDVQQQPPAPAPAPAPGGGGGGGGVDQVSKAISAVNSVNREDMLEVLNANAKVLGLDFKDLTEGGRREAVADFVYFVKWVKGDYRTVTELKEAFNKSVTTETHKMNFIRLVNETNEENAASELTTVLGQLKADAEAFLDEFEKDKIDEYYGYEFSKGLEEVIVLMEIYLDLNDKDKKNVAKKFIENDYSGSDVVAMGYLKTAIETLSTVITAVDFSVKVAEEKEFTVRVDNFTEDYESVLFKFVVTSESNETNVQKRDITLFQYKDGNAWKDMPLAEEDGKLVGYFGPQTGFPMNKGYSANTQFKVKMGKSGTYNVTISLVDLNNGEAVLASDTMIVNVSAPNLDGFDQT